MDGRYNKVIRNNYIYLGMEICAVIGIALINLTDHPFVTFLTWMIVVALCAYFLYYDDFGRPIKRVLECEILLFFIESCEFLGAAAVDFLFKIFQISMQIPTMQTYLKIAFSKVIIIFLYYMAAGKLLKNRKVPVNKMQYVCNVIISCYTLVNIFAIADNRNNKQGEYVFLISLVYIVLADLFLFYLVKLMNEKYCLKYDIKLLQNQADMQYDYYLGQEQKYNQTFQILHDVDKHIKLIGQLYASGNIDKAADYTKEIGNILQPLIPIRYTRNPILDILLTDKTVIMDEKGIDFKINIDNVNLDFIEAVDVTTIFGNLLDNSIEACECLMKDKQITINIHAFHEIISVRIENSCSDVKWKNGVPVSDKGKNRGIGLLNVKRSIEKYDGDIKFRNNNGVFVVDMFLNS